MEYPIGVRIRYWGRASHPGCGSPGCGLALTKDLPNSPLVKQARCRITDPTPYLLPPVPHTKTQPPQHHLRFRPEGAAHSRMEYPGVRTEWAGIEQARSLNSVGGARRRRAEQGKARGVGRWRPLGQEGARTRGKPRMPAPTRTGTALAETGRGAGFGREGGHRNRERQDKAGRWAGLSYAGWDVRSIQGASRHGRRGADGQKFALSGT